MNPQAINDLFEYIYWAFDLIWPSIEKLDDEQFTEDLGYSFGSIRDQIIHLISSHRRWLDRLKLIDPTPHLDTADFPDKSSTKKEWEGARREMLEYVNSLDQAALNESVNYQIQGRSIDTHHRRWEILIHLVNHSTDHRSQILAMLNSQFAIETPEQDYMIFRWGQESKT